ncbi:MAG: response regulator transcription factor [Elusimicrobiota bacterium]|nr:response regulator transcription factor [Elusimicrobiota bacterium]MDH5661716.1 response regulator transcription factor [Elusimicrobiota bacterium]
MGKGDLKKTIRILIADDHTLFREGLRKVLELEKDMEIVGEANDGAEALRLADRLKPDVILMDISFRGPNGVRITRQIKRRYRKVHVIMLSMHEDIAHITESFQSGASGYVIKTYASDELTKTIRSVVKEGVCMPPSIEHKLLKGIRKPDFLSGAKRGNLTKREVKVLKLVAFGKTNKEIAKKLFVSEKTVKNHLNHIYRKLEVKNRAQAVVEGLKRDYISGE